jgi:hypothetical protein
VDNLTIVQYLRPSTCRLDAAPPRCRLPGGQQPFPYRIVERLPATLTPIPPTSAAGVSTTFRKLELSGTHGSGCRYLDQDSFPTRLHEYRADGHDRVGAGQNLARAIASCRTIFHHVRFRATVVVSDGSGIARRGPGTGNALRAGQKSSRRETRRSALRARHVSWGHGARFCSCPGSFRHPRPIRSGVFNREVCGCGLPLLLRCENDPRCAKTREILHTRCPGGDRRVTSKSALAGRGDRSAQSQDRAVLPLFHPAVRQPGVRKCVPAVHLAGDYFGGSEYLRGSDRDPARVAAGQEDSILGSIPPQAENTHWGHDDRTGNVLSYQRKQIGAGDSLISFVQLQNLVAVAIGRITSYREPLDRQFESDRNRR